MTQVIEEVERIAEEEEVTAQEVEETPTDQSTQSTQEEADRYTIQIRFEKLTEEPFSIDIGGKDPAVAAKLARAKIRALSLSVKKDPIVKLTLNNTTALWTDDITSEEAQAQMAEREARAQKKREAAERKAAKEAEAELLATTLAEVDKMTKSGLLEFVTTNYEEQVKALPEDVDLSKLNKADLKTQVISIVEKAHS